MVETLTNLKNNKVKKTAAGQLAGSEAVERMKKWLSGLTKKRHGELPFLPRIILFREIGMSDIMSYIPLLVASCQQGPRDDI